ncbi:MAG: epoxide hydrolase [Acidimicrobiaceae bacterium]|nr:epoxide hydrolase [Acidimicrobiaceae bacterium]MXY01710.1 epoxide hydrolase [Acidimicrobiales bacterium]MYA82043.1 epoxide hydrolase [Acidimicrobiales bacterium]MYG88435.1 epoxide hydrolase [Acidimicrobiales bacterium]MYH75802.1 epoxide hydrolase [Acidimicrobiales bacterium]
MQIEPFQIDVPDEQLADLRDRLARTRWPDKEPVDNWAQGIPLAYVQEVCDYWANTYDWRAREASLNRFDQYTADVDGMNVHFIHVRSPEPDAMPIVITHGWPGSVVEFHKVIEPLADPVSHGGSASDAFHVICPSLPGYGFSAKPTEPGWGIEKIADCWAELMTGLGYDRFGAQGGDWGSAVTSALGSRHPDRCVGIHLNMVMRGSRPKDREPNDEEIAALTKAKHYNDWDSGYSKQQSTRPQTLGYGLTDSPAGQAAWILEKFWAWTDCDGHPENALGRDEMLDNVMLYWLNANAASSGRLYWESFRQLPRMTVDVPTGVAKFPAEIIPPVRAWSEPIYSDIRHWTEMPAGGHFAAFEQPELFVDDVRAFFSLLR